MRHGGGQGIGTEDHGQSHDAADSKAGPTGGATATGWTGGPDYPFPLESADNTSTDGHHPTDPFVSEPGWSGHFAGEPGLNVGSADAAAINGYQHAPGDRIGMSGLRYLDATRGNQACHTIHDRPGHEARS